MTNAMNTIFNNARALLAVQRSHFDSYYAAKRQQINKLVQSDLLTPDERSNVQALLEEIDFVQKGHHALYDQHLRRVAKVAARCKEKDEP